MDVNGGGGSSRTNILVPLCDGLSKYCCHANSVPPERMDARPDFRRSLGYRM